MCGRYTSTSAAADLARVFEVDEIKVEQLPLRYNVAPTQDVYAVATRRSRDPEEDGQAPRRQLGAFRWGLIPSWAKDPSVGNKMINARAEGIESKSAYQRPLARRRCIIPADAFYEWQVRGEQGNARSKLPYVIRHRDGSPMAFAGLWEFWRPKSPSGSGSGPNGGGGGGGSDLNGSGAGVDPNGGGGLAPDGSSGGVDLAPIRSCVIITTAANELVAPIHSRMPVVLPPRSWEEWLDPDNRDVESALRLLVPAPSSNFEAYPVSTRVNGVANEGPELIEPLPEPPGVNALL